jgi:hypothetical protein
VGHANFPSRKANATTLPVEGILVTHFQKCEMSCWLHQASGTDFVPENCFAPSQNRDVVVWAQAGA